MNKFKIWNKLCGKFCIGEFALGYFVCPDNYEYLPSTGLYDKNSVEIFDGDIIKVQYVPAKHFIKPVEFGIVKFKDGAFYLEFDTNFECTYSKLLSKYSLNLLKDRQCEIEVVGNIYENPEKLA